MEIDRALARGGHDEPLYRSPENTWQSEGFAEVARPFAWLTITLRKPVLAYSRFRTTWNGLPPGNLAPLIDRNR